MVGGEGIGVPEPFDIEDFAGEEEEFEESNICLRISTQDTSGTK